MATKTASGGIRWLRKRILHPLCLLALVGGGPSTVLAQEPMWGDDNPNGRFELLGSFDNLAILDNATGLVWLGRPLVLDLHGVTTGPASSGVTELVTSKLYNFAIEACERLSVGGVLGWRVPTVQEMATMVRASAGPIGFGFNARGCRMADGLFGMNANFFTITRNVASEESQDNSFRHVVVSRSFRSREPCIQSQTITGLSRNFGKLELMCVWSGSGHTLPTAREEFRQ